MRNFVRVAQLALVPGLALITIAMASVAEAGANLNAHLRGAYAVTTARTCTVSPVPFQGENLDIPPGAFVFRQTAVDNGITTYHGDGTATFAGRTSSININSTGGSAISISDVTADIEYTVNPDGTVDTAISSRFALVFPATGLTGTTTGQVGRSQISHGNTMLVSAPQGKVSVETQVLTPLAGVPFTQYRLCVRSATQTKLPSH